MVVWPQVSGWINQRSLSVSSTLIAWINREIAALFGLKTGHGVRDFNAIYPSRSSKMKKLLLISASALVMASSGVYAATLTGGFYGAGGTAGSNVGGGSSASGNQGSILAGAATNASAAQNQTMSGAQVTGGFGGVTTITEGNSLSTQTNTGGALGLAGQTSNAGAGGGFNSGATGNFGTIGGFLSW